jgi:hypothetical protein
MNKGVRTSRHFQKGEIVAEYTGDLLCSSAENEQRETQHAEAQVEGGHIFEFKVNNKTYWLVNINYFLPMHTYTECTYVVSLCCI